MKSKKLTTSEFVMKVEELNNKFYAYDKVNFKGMKGIITITCPIHGDFEQLAGNHLKGHGCKRCDVENRRVQLSEDFIEKSVKIHNNFYDYNKVEYENMKSKVTITCPIHGDFIIMTGSHINGLGCKKCNSKNINSIVQDTQSFIQRANLLYNNFYNYNKVEYENMNSKVTITCPIHGDFITTPRKHLEYKHCEMCTEDKIIKEFIDQANESHDNFYNYNKVKFKNSHGKVAITCPIHGDFEQSRLNHLTGHGCTKCANENKSYNKESFIEKSKEVHNDFYNYDKVNYKKSCIKVTITCPIHGNFEQKPSGHINGNGCPCCAVTYFGPTRYTNKETILYYIYFPEYNLFKIGLSRKPISARFASDIKKGAEIEVVDTKTFENGEDAYYMEQYIIRKYKEFKYYGEKILESGNTELFTKDILKGSLDIIKKKEINERYK